MDRDYKSALLLFVVLSVLVGDAGRDEELLALLLFIFLSGMIDKRYN